MLSNESSVNEFQAIVQLKREIRGREKLRIVIHTGSPDNKWVCCVFSLAHEHLYPAFLILDLQTQLSFISRVTSTGCVCFTCRLTGVESGPVFKAHTGQRSNSLLWFMNEQTCAAEWCCMLRIWHLTRINAWTLIKESKWKKKTWKRASNIYRQFIPSRSAAPSRNLPLTL